MILPAGPRFIPSPTVEKFIYAVLEGPLNEYRLLILQGSRGEGKFLPHNQLVLTPSGFVKAGDIHVGDMMIAVDGTPTEVLGVYPQSAQPLWCLKFSDDTSLVTSDDHLWSVETGWDRANNWAKHRRPSRAKPRKPEEWRRGRARGSGRSGLKVVTTRAIRKRLESGAWRLGGRWAIPLVGPVQFPAKAVPLDPYLVGLLLGDGGLTQDGVNLTTADTEIVDSVRAALPMGAAITRRGRARRYDYRISGQGVQKLGQAGRNAVLTALRDLGLMGHGAATKFIPDCYLWNEPAVRLALLNGLLDTDGTILKHSNSVSFSTISERLAEGVEFLVRSLGGITRRRMRHTHYTYNGERRAGQPSYHISVRLPNGTAPFRLSRKATIVHDKGTRNTPRRYIVGIEPAGDGGGVCFRVAHPSHLYVVDETFIVTHNTTGVIMACAALAEDLRVKGFKGFPLVVAFLRDTWTNLKRTTLPAFRENRAKGLPIEIFDGGQQATFGPIDAPWVHFWFFGLDRDEDADRLQGFTCGVLVLEEVAPAASISGGVPSMALGLGVSSVRQPGVPKRILVPMNPPDDDHWILKAEKALAEQGLDFVRVHRFEMAPAEKSAHFERLAALTKGEEAQQWQLAADEFNAYRAATQAFLEATGHGDLVTRLIHGQVGFAQMGEAVVPNFSKLLHVAKEPLQVYRNLPIIRGFDSGAGDLHPACVWVQATHGLGVNVLASRVAENVGIEEFINEQVLPLQRKYGWLVPAAGTGFGRGAHGGFQFRNIGDPACLDMSGISSQLTVAKVIQNRLGGGFDPGPQDWDSRRQALLAAFERPGKRDRPRFVQIDPEENEVLIKALSGRFHYPRELATGRINGTVEAAKRVSGLYCTDDQTEMLTLNGWRAGGDLKIGELVYAYNIRSGSLVETPLQAIHHFDGRHEVWRTSGNAWDFVATPNHTMVVKSACGRNRARSPAFGPMQIRALGDLKTSMAIVRMGVVTKRRANLSDEFVRLAAWVMAEGHFRDGLQIVLVQSADHNPGACQTIEKLLWTFPGWWSPAAAKSGMRGWRLNGPLALALRAALPRKIAGGEFISALSPTQAALFLWEYVRADGNWRRDLGELPDPPASFGPHSRAFWVRPDTPRIGQRDPAAIDALQHIGARAGIVISKTHSGDMWFASLLRRAQRTWWRSLLPSLTVEVVEGVWCPQTAFGTWVARRGGQVTVTGNSHPIMALAYILSVDFPAEDWARPPDKPMGPVMLRTPPKSWLGI